MYNRHKIRAFIVLAVSFLFFYYTKTKLTEVAASGLLTAFSVITGFYIASIFVIINSESLGRLYKEEDLKKPGNTKLQTYRTYFSNCFYWSIASIIMMVLFLTKAGSELTLPFANQNPNLFIAANSAVLSISFVNIYWTVVMFETIMVIMLYEGRDKNR